MNRLKYLEIIFRYFPLIHFSLILGQFFWIIFSPTPLKILGLVFITYALPLILWRLLFIDIKEGKQFIGKKSSKGSSWLISHYLQYTYLCFPILERPLIIIPGAFSLWLRLWGSQIGKKVIWAPTVTIYDRPLLKVDDYTFIGGETLFSSHLLKRKNGNLSSYVKKVSIGKQSLIGGESTFGPGTNIVDHSFLPAHSRAIFGKIERGSLGKTTRT